MSPKSILEYLQYVWPYRRTKLGLAAFYLPIIIFWFGKIYPYYEKSKNFFYISTIATIILLIAITVYWFVTSGRMILSNPEFTVALCLKPKDVKSNKYIENAISCLRTELDKLGLLNRFRIVIIGHDVINETIDAHKYREKFDVDLVIWGEIYSGTSNKNEICDFKKLFYTYKIPGNFNKTELINIFRADINIALINREWNIYEYNSIPDTEKISCNLSEIIFLILGIIYLQDKEHVGDSIIVLESLFNQLDLKTRSKSIQINNAAGKIIMSSDMLRKVRVLGILTEAYKGLGLYLVRNNIYDKAQYYLKKYLDHQKPDIDVLSSLALSSYKLGDVQSAKQYTDDIGKIDKHNPIYMFNKGFFGILEKNYDSALYFYKQIAKCQKVSDPSIVTQVIAFLDDKKRSDQSELAYDFAIGVVNKFHCQDTLGKTELRKFIKFARKRKEYSEMVHYAEEILNRKKKKK